VLVSAACVALMTLVAYYVAWSRRQDGRKTLGVQA